MSVAIFNQFGPHLEKKKHFAARALFVYLLFLNLFIRFDRGIKVDHRKITNKIDNVFFLRKILEFPFYIKIFIYFAKEPNSINTYEDAFPHILFHEMFYIVLKFTIELVCAICVCNRYFTLLYY